MLCILLRMPYFVHLFIVLNCYYIVIYGKGRTHKIGIVSIPQAPERKQKDFLHPTAHFTSGFHLSLNNTNPYIADLAKSFRGPASWPASPLNPETLQHLKPTDPESDNLESHKPLALKAPKA